MIEKFVTSKDIHERNAQFQKAVKAQMKKRGDLQTLENLSRLQTLENLSRLQTLENLHRLQNLQTLERLQDMFSWTTGSYQDYNHQPGDVVYCDPPYEGTAEYSTAFNHAEFYEWVKSRPFQIWFSSYQGIKGFRLVFAKRLISPYGTNNSCEHYECLYTNR